MTDTLALVQKTIKVLRQNGCTDAQVVGILLSMGTDDPASTAGDDLTSTAGDDAQRHD